MSIVSSANIIAYLEVSSYSSGIQTIHEGIEVFVKNVSGQPFESTVYINKSYDGPGGNTLRLDEIPIISIKYIIIDPYDAIKIKNTMTDSSLASVVVDATNITLTIEGGTGAGSDVLSKATNTTMALLVAAINAQSANGWSAEICDADYNALLTSQLYAQQIECVQENGVAQDWQYLQMGELAKNIKFNNKTGEVYSESGFPKGFQNIIATYTAGYATPPADIVFFIMDTVKTLYSIKTKNAEGITSSRFGDVAYIYGEIKKAGLNIPESILQSYRNIRI